MTRAYTAASAVAVVFEFATSYGTSYSFAVTLPQSAWTGTSKTRGSTPPQSRTSYYTARVVSADIWYHVALVRSGSTFVVYINGVSSMSFPTWTMQSMTTFCVGGLNYANYEYSDFYGNMQDVRMYSTAKYTGAFTVP